MAQDAMGTGYRWAGREATIVKCHNGTGAAAPGNLVAADLILMGGKSFSIRNELAALFQQRYQFGS
jgi:hypothetical protein